MQLTQRTISIAYKTLLLAAVLYGLYLSFFKPLYIENGLPSISYFTIQSNILVALATFYFLFDPRQSRFKVIIRGSILLSILITGLVFHIVLVPALPEYFAQGIAFRHHLSHTIAPLGFALDWLIFDRKGLMLYPDVRYWVIYPLLYWLFAVIQGHFSGVYPYFFTDIGTFGFGAALLWLLFLTITFVLVGFLLVWIDRLFQESSAPA